MIIVLNCFDFNIDINFWSRRLS